MTDQSADLTAPRAHERYLFAACFVALIATSFAFIIRIMVMGDWQITFGLSETQKGEIFGAGFWPFGISIVLFSLVIDRIGYGKSMIFAFLCHIASALLLISAKGYTELYIGSILNGLAAGTVEAVINPAVASTFPRQKTKMLSMLHAGWPGGMVLGGILIMAGLGNTSWQTKVAIVFIPVLAYGLMLLRCRFPVSERVAAGVSYRDMLKEAGALGALIVTYMIMKEVGRVANLDNAVVYAVIGVVTVAYYLYARSLGRPMYILLLLVMVLLASTELGVDSWVTDLMGPAMKAEGIQAGWLVIYTATIMMVLRLCGGPIVHALKPLGLLCVSASLATVGLFFLSTSHGIWILVMATVYGCGKTFFWPVTLGLVAERFPRGGALTLNAIAGVGMLAVGTFGNPWMGYLQDTRIDRKLQSNREVHRLVMDSKEKRSVLGTYRALNGSGLIAISDKIALYEYRAKIAKEGEEGAAADRKLADDKTYQSLVKTACGNLLPKGSSLEREDLITYAAQLAYLQSRNALINNDEYGVLTAAMKKVSEVTVDAKHNAMSTTAILPLIMAVCYLGLIAYFRTMGGYKAIELTVEGQSANTPAR